MVSVQGLPSAARVSGTGGNTPGTTSTNMAASDWAVGATGEPDWTTAARVALDSQSEAAVAAATMAGAHTAGGKQVEGERAWREAVGEDSGLRDYAEAAEEVGNRAWVITALHWCMTEMEGFLWGGGAVEAEIKSSRVTYFRHHGERMPTELEDAARQALKGRLTVQGGGMVPRGGGVSKPLLIDVGSCWDYFRRHDDKFAVIALDLCPRRDTVLQCDFLDLEIGSPESAERISTLSTIEAGGLESAGRISTLEPDRRGMLSIPDGASRPASVSDLRKQENVAAVGEAPVGTGDKGLATSKRGDGNIQKRPSTLPEGITTGSGKLQTGDADFQKVLEALPAGCANAVVMSLVLSYVPTPRQRGEMIRRARELLADEGRGLLLLITPHSTDKGHNPHKSIPVLKEWREAIESMGFERYRYTRLRSVHAIAYRTVGVGRGNVGPGMAPPMRIAFDGPDVDMTPPSALDAR